ncbi:ogdh, partial [Symbiodinium necroappetens]
MEDDGALAPPDPVPLFHRPDLQALAIKRDLRGLGRPTFSAALGPKPARTLFMADLSAELLEARAEFDTFGAYMQTPPALQQQRQKVAETSAPSTELGTTPAPTPTPSQDGSETMEVDKDREKRAADQQSPKDAPPPSKWAKGDAKGDSKPEETQSGKGRAAEGLPQQSQAARGSGQNLGSGAGQGSSLQDTPATDKTGGQSSKPSSQQLANWRKHGNYRQWPNNQSGGNQRWESKDAKELRELKEAVKALGRMSLRMEDALGVIHLDSEYILFLQTEAAGNEWAITRQLYDTAVE